jgi:glutamyl-tRNA synthetase
MIRDATFIESLTHSSGTFMATLTVSSKQTPFPFSAVAIAAYTQKAGLVFDETVAGITLQLNGSAITDEAEIVQALAKEYGLSEDSLKVGRGG